jgi:hypothetical protein
MKILMVLMLSASVVPLAAQDPAPPAPTVQPATLMRPTALRPAGGAAVEDKADATEAQLLLRALSRAQRELFARSDAARKKGEPFNEIEADPTPRYRPLFRALADQGDVDALLWCTAHTTPVRPERAGEADDHQATRAAFRKDLAALLDKAQGRHLAAAARTALGHAGETISHEEADRFCEAAIAKDSSSAGGILSSMAGRAMDEPGDAARAKATALYERALGVESDPAAKQRITGRLFALNHLREGMKAPELSGTDFDGKSVKLADYQGRVTFLEFWGFW